MIIYHIASKSDWEQAQKKGIYAHPTLETQRFIHASTSKQVIPTANRRFSDQKDLLILVIETKKLTKPIKFELASTGQKHPHIYEPVPIEAIIDTFTIKKNQSGEFKDKAGKIK